MPEDYERKHKLAKIVEGSVLLFVELVDRLEGKRGREIKKYIFHVYPKWQRWFIGSFIDCRDAFKKLVVNRMDDDERLNESDARLAIIASPYLWEMSELVLGEKPPSELYIVLWAFRSMLPWNRTGYNEITVDTITNEDIKESLKFLDKHLGKDWEFRLIN